MQSIGQPQFQQLVSVTPGALQRTQMPVLVGNRDSKGGSGLTVSTCAARGPAELLESPSPQPAFSPGVSAPTSGGTVAASRDVEPEDPSALSEAAAAAVAAAAGASGRRSAAAAAAEAAAVASAGAASWAGASETPSPLLVWETPGVEETAAAVARPTGAWTGRPTLSWATVLV